MRVDVQASQEAKNKHEVRSDDIFRFLADKSPSDVDAYIENQVTDLASAKRVLKTLAKIVVIMSKRL